jgi:di/tripeptidase
MDEQAIRDSLTERLVRYCQIDSGSIKGIKNPDGSDMVPSTDRQRTFVGALEEEAQSNGFHTEIKDWGLYVRLNANVEGATPMTLSAHADTTQDAPNEGVEVMLTTWQGNDIHLPSGEVISANASEELESCRYGDTIFTSNGNTLLGGDDKAGIAIGMETLLKIKESGMAHGDVELAITYDEETGLLGAQKIIKDDIRGEFVLVYDSSKGEMGTGTFNAAGAYPIIKAELLEEGKNAYGATIRINGKNTFPGFGKKDKMVDPFRTLPAVMEILGAEGIPVTDVKCDSLDALELRVAVEDAKQLSKLGEIEDARLSKGNAVNYLVDDNLSPVVVRYDLSQVLALVNATPYEMAAETTEERVGYIQPYSISKADNGDDLKVDVLLRDHDADLLTDKKRLVEGAIPGIEIKDQYQNKEAALAKHPEFLELIDEAFAHAGVEEPLSRTTIRGGDESFVYTVALGKPSVNLPAFLDSSIHTVRERASLDVMHQGVKAAIYVANHFAQGKD